MESALVNSKKCNSKKYTGCTIKSSHIKSLVFSDDRESLEYHYSFLKSSSSTKDIHILPNKPPARKALALANKEVTYLHVTKITETCFIVIGKKICEMYLHYNIKHTCTGP